MCNTSLSVGIIGIYTVRYSDSLDRAKSTLGLNTSVHTEQRAVNAVQIIQNLCVKLRQLLVQTDDPVSLALAAFFLVRTAAAILALKIFLGSAVFIAPYRPAVNEMEFLSVRADWQTTFIDREIYRSVWIIAIFLVLAFFFIHGKLHEFFHAVFFAVEIIIIAIVMWLGGGLSCNNHIYCMSVLQYFSISLTDAYPFSMNANSIIFSKVF